MPDPKIEPHQVTKPIQLLAAWLVGLILVNGSFLGAAAAISQPTWIPGALTIASVLNVPLFLFAIFLLQTKYRPEMQEDSFYSKYLDRQTNISESSVSSQISLLRNEMSDSSIKTLALIESVQKEVSLISSDGSADEAGDLIESIPLRDRLNKFGEQLRLAQAGAKWDRYFVNLNDLLPGYKNISDDLADIGIGVSKTFGSTSRDPETPRVGIFTFGKGVDKDAVKTVVNILMQYGIDNISYSDEYNHMNKLYIGSYIYNVSDETYTEIDEDILRIINDEEKSIMDLTSLIRSRTVRVSDAV